MIKYLTDEEIKDLCVKIFTDINREVDSGVLEEKHKILDIIEDEDVGVWEMVEYLLFEIRNIDTKSLTFKTIEQDGGEGQGEYACGVIFFHDKLTQENGTYYKFEYEYYSYSGYNFDDLTVTKVVPVSKTITVYE